MSFTLPKTNKSSQYWPVIPGQMDALVLAEQIQQSNLLWVIFVPNMPAAEQLESALKFFLNSQAQSAGKQEIVIFPDWETLPYDSFSPHQDIISQRIQCLYRLPTMTSGVLIVPLSTALVRLPPKAYIAGSTLILKQDQKLNIESYRRELESAGYRAVDTVYEHGEYATRGSILDIFPMGHHTPYRIDLFDDEIETIRQFDPETQRSGDKISDLKLLPAHEFPLTNEARKRFKHQFYEQFPNSPLSTPIVQDIAKGIASPGIEYYLSLFFESTCSLFDYLSDQTQLVLFDQLHNSCDHFWQELNSRYEDLRHNIERPILNPDHIYLRTEQFFAEFKRFNRIELKPVNLAEIDTEYRFRPLPEVDIQAKLADPIAHLKALKAAGYRICLCAESTGREQVLIDTFKDFNVKLTSLKEWQKVYQSKPDWGIIVAELAKGFVDETNKIAVIAEPDLYQDRVPQRRRRKRTQESQDNIVQNLTELKVGAAVVHIDHGIGRYKGLQTLDAGGQTQEFLLLEYAKGDKLYVPVSSLHMISRYTGIDDSHVPITKLGSDRWTSTKRNATEKIKDTAAELLEIYARREAHQGFASKAPDESYRNFAGAFPFEETPDQLHAIEAVIGDMTRKIPMDRLVCGDVGFGKTEVAMRAAFLAANSGRQVAVLVPTTLLAQQHFQSFQDRFSDTAINIESISRFRTGKDVEKIKNKLEEGQVDIVVGTHKLLQKDIKFKNLGLLIIDEEHRFGVRQKDQVKALRANIDILTMTATPIPRTLNMSLQGVRNLSIIGTPPERRLAVKTFVQEQSDAIVKEAILREILRGGQVFYLHNEVDTIDKTASDIEKLVPDANVIVAHGQMRERQLERVMSDFYHKRYNVLVCTTIIETGIDIPSANTIIMDRADNLGIAQLHQLRGRVGRSHHQAYAYLLTPPPRVMTEDARKRLEAISNAQDLGAGFTLATHDLEIRGAGELLGDEQSGHIQNIGFSLYSQLLDAAVKAMKKGEELDLNQPIETGCEINFRIPALIPDDYLPDVHNRLILYKRISSAASEDALKDLQVEMIDRFGLLPDATKNLFRQQSIKLVADALGISKIDLGPSGGTFEFAAKTKVEPMRLVSLIQQEPNKYKLEGGNKIRVKNTIDSPDARFQFAEKLLTGFQ